MANESGREGGLDAPTRHPLDQNNPDFWNEDLLNTELERVFDICHGCRRCVSLCNAFPTLFDLVDESETMEVDGVDIADYGKVVDQCYLCDLCYLTKCPYVPPHEWNVDFPHLMLRAKAVKFRKGDTRFRDNLITSTDLVGKMATAPLVSNAVNAANKSGALRGLLDKTLAIHRDARLPEYVRPTLRNQFSGKRGKDAGSDEDGKRVLLFTTCYCNYNEPNVGSSLIRVLEHNDVEVSLMNLEHCCGMPKLELGDFKSVEKLMERNLPELYEKASAGYSIIAAVPSCVLMFKQELPLMFPEDERVSVVAAAFNDPFEYLFKLHREGRLNTDFTEELGDISYHVACHQRVQNIGPKTRQVLELVPGTSVHSIERCSGHDGTYGVKKETLKFANKIAAPIVRQVKQKEPDHFGSDCPVAGRHIENNLDNGMHHEHPIELLCRAYGLR